MALLVVALAVWLVLALYLVLLVYGGWKHGWESRWVLRVVWVPEKPRGLKVWTEKRDSED